MLLRGAGNRLTGSLQGLAALIRQLIGYRAPQIPSPVGFHL
jgi:hypothetical protein